MSRVNLDDRKSYSKLDSFGMLSFAVGFADQVKEAAHIGRAFEPPKEFSNPTLVVLSGMGGSAVAGDFLSRLCEDKSSAPILVNRSYHAPAYVGPLLE